jgi:hypothetical protein
MSELAARRDWSRRLLLLAALVGGLWLFTSLAHGTAAHAETLKPRPLQLLGTALTGARNHPSGTAAKAAAPSSGHGSAAASACTSGASGSRPAPSAHAAAAPARTLRHAVVPALNGATSTVGALVHSAVPRTVQHLETGVATVATKTVQPVVAALSTKPIQSLPVVGLPVAGRPIASLPVATTLPSLATLPGRSTAAPGAANLIAATAIAPVALAGMPLPARAIDRTAPQAMATAAASSDHRPGTPGTPGHPGAPSLPDPALGATVSSTSPASDHALAAAVLALYIRSDRPTASVRLIATDLLAPRDQAFAPAVSPD